MSISLSDLGADAILTAYFGVSTPPTSWTLGLFQNDVTPDSTTLLGGLTPCTFDGYSAKTLNEEGGAAPAATVGDDGLGVAQVSWPQQTWTAGATVDGLETIYGYYIADGSTLIVAERVATPFAPTNENDTFSVTPIIKLGNETDTF